MNDTFLDLYNEFLTYADKGDEAGARKFLIDNLKQFPEEVRKKLTFAFFEEALIQQADDIDSMAEMQKQGLEAMREIDKAKKILEDQVRIKDLKDKLTN